MTALFLFYIQDPPGAFPGFFTPGLGGRYAAGRLSGGVASGCSLQGSDLTTSLTGVRTDNHPDFPCLRIPNHLVFINIVSKSYNWLLFNKIVSKPQADILSTFVFNNIVRLTFILGPPFFSAAPAGS
jgi:hypothetical protein